MKKAIPLVLLFAALIYLLPLTALLFPEGEAAAPGQVRYGWQCTLCGYIEEGYPDGLPADYTCPICGVGPDMFERIEL